MRSWVFFLKYVRTIIKKEAVPDFETASFLIHSIQPSLVFSPTAYDIDANENSQQGEFNDAVSFPALNIIL